MVSELQLDAHILLNWFNLNFLKLNPDKGKLLISNKQDDLSINIQGENIVCEKSVKLLGIQIDNQLTFSEHISNICKKVSLKLHALARVSLCMDQDKLRLLMKAFIESQFSYCSLIWMFQSNHGALYNWRGNSFSWWTTRGLFTRRKNMGKLDISSLKHV